MPTSPTIEDGKYVETLVGEGKKFKDLEALAKGKLEADNFIARMQAENEELRQELKTRVNLEEALREIKTVGTQAPSNPPAHQPGEQAPPSNTPKSLSQEDIDVLLEAKLKRRQEEENRTRNLEAVKRELTKAWGASAQSQLRQKAEELGVGAEFLDDMAAKTPTAFLKLVGADKPTDQRSDFTPPRNSVVSQTMNAGGKTWSYYQKMLQNDPAKYHSRETQLEIYKQAQAMGPDFYK